MSCRDVQSRKVGVPLTPGVADLVTWTCEAPLTRPHDHAQPSTCRPCWPNTLICSQQVRTSSDRALAGVLYEQYDASSGIVCCCCVGSHLTKPRRPSSLIRSVRPPPPSADDPVPPRPLLPTASYISAMPPAITAIDLRRRAFVSVSARCWPHFQVADTTSPAEITSSVRYKHPKHSSNSAVA